MIPLPNPIKSEFEEQKKGNLEGDEPEILDKFITLASDNQKLLEAKFKDALFTNVTLQSKLNEKDQEIARLNEIICNMQLNEEEIFENIYDD